MKKDSNVKGTWKEPKERVSVTLTETMMRRLEAVASDLGVTKGQYVAMVTGQAVNNQERIQDAIQGDMLKLMLDDAINNEQGENTSLNEK